MLCLLFIKQLRERLPFLLIKRGEKYEFSHVRASDLRRQVMMMFVISNYDGA
jgi:hypothetical protein